MANLTHVYLANYNICFGSKQLFFYNSLVEQARRDIDMFYNTESMAKKYEDIYEGCSAAT